MKIINAIHEFGPQLSEKRMKGFLVNSKLNLQLATTDSYGDTMIHPSWSIFFYLSFGN